jgi:hypothetical protein
MQSAIIANTIIFLFKEGSLQLPFLNADTTPLILKAILFY